MLQEKFKMTILDKILPTQKKIIWQLQDNVPIIAIWIIFRLITSATVAFASSIRPITEIEKRVGIWPPSMPIFDWLERVFLSPWIRWDVEWYIRIINNGYSSSDGTTNFHPLFPILGKLLLLLKIKPVFGLLIISSSATFVLLVLLKKLVTLDYGPKSGIIAPFVLLVFPVSFVLYAPYPESLFILLSILCFYSIRKGKWMLAGISASLAIFTRQQGLFLIFPYLFELWEASGRTFRGVRVYWRNWITITLIPFSYIVWIGYRLLYLKDGPLITTDFQGMIYSILISPNANRVVPIQKFQWPWETLYLGFSKLWLSPDIDIWINILIALLFTFLMVAVWKKLRPSYKIYSATITLVSFSYYTGPIHPMMGLPRHLFLAFPILISITSVILRRNQFMWLYEMLGFSFFIILLVMYTWMAWIP